MQIKYWSMAYPKGRDEKSDTDCIFRWENGLMFIMFTEIPTIGQNNLMQKVMISMLEMLNSGCLYDITWRDSGIERIKVWSAEDIRVKNDVWGVDRNHVSREVVQVA